MQQLSFIDSIVKGIPLSENEQQFILNNLLMTNDEIAKALNRTEGSIRNFLYKNQIKRTDEQLYKIRLRIVSVRLGENNPNFKDWASRNPYKYQLKSIARYPERYYARKRFNQAVRKGAIKPKEQCEKCDATGRIEAHHSDYSKPFEVEWLCKPCHMIADDERRWRELRAEDELK